MSAIEMPWGSWSTPITPESLFSRPSDPGYPFEVKQQLYWLQGLPEEGGRIALMSRNHTESTCLLPSPFNIRTRVHEYGGRCFCLCGEHIVFNNFQDGRLYRFHLSGKHLPSPVTVENDTICGYADLVYLQQYDAVVAVVEESRAGAEHCNSLVVIALNKRDPERLHVPQILASGSDFYAAPTIDADGGRVAWIEWDHPNMPWDQNRLMIATIAPKQDTISIAETGCLLGDADCAISQPGFTTMGQLVYARDDSQQDWSALFLWDGQQHRQLTSEAAEFGEAHWVFGQHRWCQVDDQRLIAIASDHDGDRLLSVRLDGSGVEQEIFRQAGLCHLWAKDNHLHMVVMAEDRPACIGVWDQLADSFYWPGAATQPLMTEGYSQPEALCCMGADGESSWANFYPPFNPGCRGPDNSPPPAIVMVHGGPTSHSSRVFHPLRQYFASLGFAVLDINHRGSTGYGRRYRQRLLGNWGEMDVADIISCMDHAIANQLVDSSRVFIRGGSAGGYAVLRALTRFPERFAGGACYYGIGNLVTLSEITHKFESCYANRLLGEDFDPQQSRQPGSRYMTRSPLNELENLRAPLILFQGLDDKVVPPEVSREIVQVLEQQGIHYQYTEYAGEGHGFRKTASRVDSLKKETSFYRDILGIK